MSRSTPRRRYRGVTEQTQQHALKLRKRMTKAERMLWRELKEEKLDGLHFRRQQPYGPFILDFLCAKLKLVVEVDGASHEGREEYDRRRTIYLKGHGFTVIRFTNEEVYEDVESVVGRIWEVGLMVERFGNRIVGGWLLPPDSSRRGREESVPPALARRGDEVWLPHSLMMMIPAAPSSVRTVQRYAPAGRSSSMRACVPPAASPSAMSATCSPVRV